MTPEITGKFELDHPLRGRQMQVGWVKIGHFDENLATTRKRHKIDAWLLLKSYRYRKSYAIYQMAMLLMTLRFSSKVTNFNPPHLHFVAPVWVDLVRILP